MSVSDTKIRPLMHEWGSGEVRANWPHSSCSASAGSLRANRRTPRPFYKLKYINSNNDQTFRDKVFQFTFEDGFVFSSGHFSAHLRPISFPFGFLIWDLANHKKLEAKKIDVAVSNDDMDKIGRKVIVSEHRDRFLSKWIDRPEATEIFPPLGSAISVKGDNDDVRDRVAKGFLASLMSKGNDVQNHNYVALLSGPYVSAGALSIVRGEY